MPSTINFPAPPDLVALRAANANVTCMCGCKGSGHYMGRFINYCTTIKGTGTRRKRCGCKKFHPVGP